MSNVVRFPGGRKQPPAKAIPWEQFEQLAELSLDMVEIITKILDTRDGDLDFEDVDPDLEPDADGEPSLGAPENHHGSQVVWLRGGDRDQEDDRGIDHPYC